MGTLLTSETEPQRLFIIVPWAAVAHSFALKSSTRLVVCIRVSPSDANRMSVLPKVTDHASVSQQKVFWKIKPFPACPGAKNRVSRGDPSIFRAPTSVFLTGSPSFCGVGGVYRYRVDQSLLSWPSRPSWPFHAGRQNCHGRDHCRDLF